MISGPFPTKFPHLKVRRPNLWLANIVLGNDLVPASNESLPEAMQAIFYNAILRHQAAS